MRKYRIKFQQLRIQNFNKNFDLHFLYQVINIQQFEISADLCSNKNVELNLKLWFIFFIVNYHICQNLFIFIVTLDQSMTDTCVAGRIYTFLQ